VASKTNPQQDLTIDTEERWDKRTITVEGELWDKRKLARFLGVSVYKVDQWVSKKQGPRHIKVGVLVRFKPADVFAFLDSCPSGGGKARPAA
jgi:predicted DNA-binding transcriptional regulator AlpA